MAEKDYIDITPQGVDAESTGVKGLKRTEFQEKEWSQIRNNPARLTVEGIKERIRLWNHSSNAHVQIKYKTMLKHCQNIAKSGVTKDGKVIWSRDFEGKPKWVSHNVKVIEEKK